MSTTKTTKGKTMTSTKTAQDIFDYKQKVEELGLTSEAANALFTQIMRYQNTHDSLLAEYGQITRRAKSAMDSLIQGKRVSTIDLVNGNADRITELVFTLKTQADTLTTMEHALGVKINWSDFITYK